MIWLKSREFVLPCVNLRHLLNILAEVSKRELDRCVESREEIRAKM